jgi:hypothetical protein
MMTLYNTGPPDLVCGVGYGRSMMALPLNRKVMLLIIAVPSKFVA